MTGLESRSHVWWHWQLTASVSQLKTDSVAAHTSLCQVSDAKEKDEVGRELLLVLKCKKDDFKWFPSLQVWLEASGAAAPSLRSPGDHPDQCSWISVQVRSTLCHGHRLRLFSGLSHRWPYFTICIIEIHTWIWLNTFCFGKNGWFLCLAQSPALYHLFFFFFLTIIIVSQRRKISYFCGASQQDRMSSTHMKSNNLITVWPVNCRERRTEGCMTEQVWHSSAARNLKLHSELNIT